MFGVNRLKLLEGLRHIRAKNCAYGGSTEYCDCKFGATGHGEETGCPEIRQVRAILNKMSDRQFLKLCKKADIIV